MLATVEIPGLAAAIRQESDVRRRAFLPLQDSICGVNVRRLTLRDMVWLEEMQNGFFCPWRFDTDEEVAAHCAQLVWWLSDCPKPSPVESRLTYKNAKLLRRRYSLCHHLSKDPVRLVKETMDYLKEAFMDAPKGNGTSFSAPHVAGPVATADLLAAAGFNFTTDQMLDLPLVQLWQYCRMARRRLLGEPLTNPSDKIACDYLAALNNKGAN